MNNTKITLLVLVALVLGAVAGYYYGNSQGIKKGIAIGKEQSASSGAGKTAVKDVQDAANPYTKIQEAANPFKGYTNPFAK